MDATLELLKTDTKFYGGDDRKFVWASGARLDPGGHNNKRVAIYNLKAGETYTLTLSGRSQQFKADTILFRHEEVPADEALTEEVPHEPDQEHCTQSGQDRIHFTNLSSS